MPTYVSICHICDTKHDYFRTIENRNNTPECCGVKTEKIIVPPMIGAMSWVGHKGVEVNGKYIETGAEYKKYMNENRLIPESEANSEATYQRKQREKTDDAHLNASVERAIHQHL